MKKITMAVVLVLSGLILALNLGWIRQWKHQQFVYLAESFLQGKTYFLQIPGSLVDTIPDEGRYYWPLGPLPALLLTLPVWMWDKSGGFFQQGYLNVLVVAGVWLGAVMLARRAGYKQDDSIWLGTAFCFASVFGLSATVPFSWYFLQSLTAFFSIWAINEWWVYKRPLIIGIMMAMAFLARPTAALGILFFTAMAVSGGGKLKDLVAIVIKLWTPVVIAVIIWAGYNQIRFGDWKNTGYTNASVGTFSGREMLKKGRLFELGNIPRNTYFYFFNLDMRNILSLPGTSFFVVSPIFLLIFRTDYKKRMVKIAALTALVILATILMYYWPGHLQIGPRYMIDLLPFLYLLLLYSFPGFKLTKISKIVICLSIVGNLVLLKTIFPVLY